MTTQRLTFPTHLPAQAARQALRLGLAFSGGGYRAAVLHLGVLARLAEEPDDLLSQVAVVSTVSGGSLGMALVYRLNNYQWPSSAAYLPDTVRGAWHQLTSADIECAFIERALEAVMNWPLAILVSRAGQLARVLREDWGLKRPLGDLDPEPRWVINATCYESGKNWRFERTQFGDERFGQCPQTQAVALSDALAASAGFPGLVGALAFPIAGLKFAPPPAEDRCAEPPLTPQAFPTVHLWDGGVYDNLGLEVFDPMAYAPDQPGWEGGVNFLIVSDASSRARPATYAVGWQALMRILTGIMMDQVRTLRSRSVVARMRAAALGSPGVVLQIGQESACVLEASGRATAEEIAQVRADSLPAAVVQRTEALQTTLRRLDPGEFETVFRHGFELADAALFAQHRERLGFQHRPYQGSRAGQLIAQLRAQAATRPRRGFRPCSWLAEAVRRLRGGVRL